MIRIFGFILLIIGLSLLIYSIYSILTIAYSINHNTYTGFIDFLVYGVNSLMNMLFYILLAIMSIVIIFISIDIFYIYTLHSTSRW